MDPNAAREERELWREKKKKVAERERIEEGVSCMFHTFLNMGSVICMELKVYVHNSLSPTQVNDLSWADMEQKLENTMKLE